MKCFWLLLFLIGNHSTLNAQQLIEITNTVYSKNNEVPYFALLYPNYPGRQNIISYNQSYPHNGITKSVNRKFSFWMRGNVADTNIIRSLLVIEKEVNNNAVGIDTFNHYSPDTYLKCTKKINHKKKRIKKIAGQLKAETFDNTIANILSFINTSITSIDSKKLRSANSVVKRGSGNMRERLHVAMAIARALDIPSRGVKGTLLTDSEAKAHQWLEFYDQGVGWVPYELDTAKSLANTMKNGNRYIYQSVELATLNYNRPPIGQKLHGEFKKPTPESPKRKIIRKLHTDTLMSTSKENQELIALKKRSSRSFCI